MVYDVLAFGVNIILKIEFAGPIKYAKHTFSLDVNLLNKMQRLERGKNGKITLNKISNIHTKE